MLNPNFKPPGKCDRTEAMFFNKIKTRRSFTKSTMKFHFGFRIQDFGSWLLDFEFWILRILDMGFWILDCGAWISDFKEECMNLLAS